MERGDSDDGQAMSRTAQCDGPGEYGVTEDPAGDDVDPAAHRHCQEIYLTGSNGSNPSGRDRRKPAMNGHSSVVSPGHSDGGSAPSNGHSTAGGEGCFIEHHSGQPSLPIIGRS
jgi:hypothetical protein